MLFLLACKYFLVFYAWEDGEGLWVDYLSKLACNTFSQPLKPRKKAPTRPAENQGAQWSEGEKMAKKDEI